MPLLKLIVAVLLDPTTVVGGLAVYLGMQIYRGSEWLPVSVMLVMVAITLVYALTGNDRVDSLPLILLNFAAVFVWYFSIDLMLRVWAKITYDSE